MNMDITLRVTSVWQSNHKLNVFAGVPLTDEQRVKTARHIVVVRTKPELLPMEPTIGQHWQVYGSVVRQQAERNGFQITELHITPSKCQVTLPNDGEQFIKFIATEPVFKGIGEVKARELWQTFGQSIYSVIEQAQTKRLLFILTQKAIDALYLGYKKYANLKYANWFAEHKIPPAITQRLFKHHGETSVQSIVDDPYRLLAFGMSFKKVDELARVSFGIVTTDSRRLVGAVEYALHQHTAKGHTVATHQSLSPLVNKLLECNELTAQALLGGHGKGAFVLDYEHGTYHPTAMLVMEHVVAKRLLKLKTQPTGWQHIHDVAYHESVCALPYSLTVQQSAAVAMAMENSISCITGGAGTGKTCVLRTVLAAYNKLQYNIKAIALSGRAAMRLYESTGFITSTIAKFLREEPLGEDKCLVVIDEASMIDLQTMYRIVTHISPNTRLLLVGDPDQLAPIGAGLVLADIVKSGVIPNTVLEIVKRQKGATGIPEYSKVVKSGAVPQALTCGNIHFHDVPLAQVSEKCVELYAEDAQQSQIIGATYKAPQGGIDAINRRCQEQCNPNGRQFEFELFGERNYLDIWLNDPVVITQNDYEAGVQNGTLGWLVSIEQTANHFGVIKVDTGEDIQLTRSLLDSIRPGYAISLHKAQGSQFPRVIVPITSSKMLDRNWVYTAITRAEIELHLVGPASLFRAAVKRVGATVRRQTHLSNMLK